MQEISGKGFQIPAKPPSVPSPAHGKLKSALRNRHGLAARRETRNPSCSLLLGTHQKSPSDLKGAHGGGQKSDQLCPALGSTRGMEQGGAGGSNLGSDGPMPWSILGFIGAPMGAPRPAGPTRGVTAAPWGAARGAGILPNTARGGDKPAVKPSTRDACAGLGAIRGTGGQLSRPCPLGSAPPLSKSREGRQEGCVVQG